MSVTGKKQGKPIVVGFDAELEKEALEAPLKSGAWTTEQKETLARYYSALGPRNELLRAKCGPPGKPRTIDSMMTKAARVGVSFLGVNKIKEE